MIKKRAFTLIELLVATAVFSVVMVIALGALLSLSEANRRAEILNASVSNLNFSLDSISRAIRTGVNYHCGTSGIQPFAPNNCATPPGTYFAFVAAADGSKVAYCFDTVAKAIKRQVIAAGASGTLSTDCTSSSFISLTSSPDVVVTNLAFYVTGAALGDSMQPKVTILISAYVLTKATQKSYFNLQTSVTQRIYDI